jgi:hypothetical protein
MPTPNQSRYQFSLRSLLLWTVFVAVVCSIGVCIHWCCSLAIALPVVAGGIAGWIVAGTRQGFVMGVAVGFLFLGGDIFICSFLSAIPQVANAPWQLFAGLHVIVALIGGFVGGATVRPRAR